MHDISSSVKVTPKRSAYYTWMHNWQHTWSHNSWKWSGQSEYGLE